MFDAKDISALDPKYFSIIFTDAFDVTIMSRNTGHYWFIHNPEYPTPGTCIIFHKLDDFEKRPSYRTREVRIEEEQIIISNRCILPEGWTAETLMQPHDSIPYNPDIANVFYRAGYIETWGQGIQKICDECIALGAELPRYEILGTGIRVYFTALKSALIDQPKAPKHQNSEKHGALDDAMVLRIIEKLKEQPDISQEALGESIGVTRRVVQKYINALKEAGRIERVGGKRYGHWEIKE